MRNRRLAESPASQAAQRSYDPTYFERLFAIEDRHFWFHTRNRVIATVVSQIVAGLAPGYRVLEVGCGTGNVLRVLEQACPRGTVVGMDLFAEGLQYAHQRTNCPLVQGDMHMPPFGAQFDLIGLFDVLEHLPDDMQVLRDLHAMLAFGGVLLLTVPAHPSLWSYFDEASHHCRRYELAELENKLIGTSYRVEYITQYMASIFPLVWLGRRLTALTDRRRAGDAGHTHDLAARELRITPVVNDLLALLLAQEARLIARRRPLSIGTSLLAVARKDLKTTQ
jgi:SAM-dependent methyltransferase